MLDNIFVERMLAEANSIILNSIASIQRQGITHVMQRAFTAAEAVVLDLENLGEAMGEIPQLQEKANHDAAIIRKYISTGKEQEEVVRNMQQQLSELSDQKQKFDQQLQLTNQLLEQNKKDKERFQEEQDKVRLEFRKQREELEARFEDDRNALQKKVDSKIVDEDEKEKLQLQLNKMQAEMEEKERSFETSTKAGGHFLMA